jgi:hypothetical protein
VSDSESSPDKYAPGAAGSFVHGTPFDGFGPAAVPGTRRGKDVGASGRDA